MCKSTRYLYLENPEVFKQIHPTKNEGVDLMKLTVGSNKHILWKCERNHEWEARINSRHAYISKTGIKHKGNGCPYCDNQKVCLDNCLATVNPDVAKEWHPTKNENLTPFDVVAV